MAEQPIKKKKPGRPRVENPVTSVFSCGVTASELDLLKRTRAGKWARAAIVRLAKKKDGTPQH